VSCNKVRRELLEQFRFPMELGPCSGPHLAHLESCAACREEVGINRELVEQLRRALRERVESSDPSAASWDLVRRRALDRPARSWATRVMRLAGGGLLPAAVAGVLMFATVSETGFLDGPGAPVPITTSIESAEGADQADGSETPLWLKYRAEQSSGALAAAAAEIGPKLDEMPRIIRSDGRPPLD
jgi:hypothetical protein